MHRIKVLVLFLIFTLSLLSISSSLVGKSKPPPSFRGRRDLFACVCYGDDCAPCLHH